MRAYFIQLLTFVFILTELSSPAWASSFSRAPANNEYGKDSRTSLNLDFNPESGRLSVPDSPEKLLNYNDLIDDRAQEVRYKDYSPRELRAQFASLQNLAHKENRFKTAVSSTAMHFGTETIYFHIVLGAMAVHQTMTRNALDMNSSKINEHGKNPVAYELLYDSLQDPIAHFSFFNFMVANRLTADWLMDPAIRPTQKKMFLSLFVPGVAMTAGSIVSHLTGQVAMTFNACVMETFKEGREQKRLGLKDLPAAPKPEGKDHCEQAWEMWKSEKMFHTFAPTITSMLLATLTGGLSSYLVKALLFDKKVDKFGRVKLVAKSSLKNSRLKLIKTLRVNGFSWRFLFKRTGGWIPIALRAGAKLGHIGVFLVAQEKFLDETERIFGNLFRGTSLGYLTPGKSTPELGQELNSLMQAPRDKDWAVKANTYLESFSENMQEWRRVNNATVEKAHGMWQEKTLGFLTSVRLAKKYYSTLIDDMKLSLARKKAESDPNNRTIILTNDFATRTYPLYGVTPWADSMAYTDAEETANYYFKNPDKIEADQIKLVTEKAKVFCQDIQGPEINKVPQDKKVLQNICTQLTSGDRHKIGAGLNLLNRQVLIRQRKVGELPEVFGSKAKELMSQLRRDLGNPYPLLYPLEGFGHAFDLFQQHRIHAETFPKVTMGRYYREKISDYMLFKMVCGSTSDSDRIQDSDGWRLNFNPPKLVTVQNIESPQLFCNARPKAAIPENRSSMIYREVFKTEKGQYNGIAALIYDNLLPEVRQLIYSSNPEENMNVWWERQYSPAIDSTFMKLKDEYSLVRKKMVDNLFQKRSIFNLGPSENNLFDILAQEVRTNMMIQADLLKNLIRKNPQIPANDLFAPVTLINEFQATYQPEAPVSESIIKQSIANHGRSALLDLQKYLWFFDYDVFANYQARKEVKEPEIFFLHANVQRLLMNQLAFLSNLEEVNSEYLSTYDQQVDNVDQMTQEVFADFPMSEAEKALVQSTTSNIRRLLSEIHTYILLFEGISSDTALTKDNAVKKEIKAPVVKGGRAQ